MSVRFPSFLTPYPSASTHAPPTQIRLSFSLQMIENSDSTTICGGSPQNQQLAHLILSISWLVSVSVPSFFIFSLSASRYAVLTQNRPSFSRQNNEISNSTTICGGIWTDRPRFTLLSCEYFYLGSLIHLFIPPLCVQEFDISH